MGAVVLPRQWGQEGGNNQGDSPPPNFYGRFHYWVETRVKLVRPNRRLLLVMPKDHGSGISQHAAYVPKALLSSVSSGWVAFQYRFSDEEI